ncbi:tetratricopeptide repeat protein [Legionella quateirensis]|uniref:Tetratricopeptide repeat n=1 Tax=Legionella quateirensis TaxID=45072 RepID=A0A378KSM0_9GAMM|nr:tetratricopeptide repeat protein [Legionella quateirensis]KTD51183.1 Tetratricopeptide repeat protein [Legionella quateirensis]STY17573.1 Tetratricopeptide repeat [Legionella quateirensis]
MKDKAKKLVKAAERFLNQKRYEKAEAKLQEAFKLSPDSDIAWYTKGLVHLAKKEYAEAVYIFEKVADSYPVYEVRATLKINLICYEARNFSPEELEELKKPSVQVLRDVYCTPQYQNEFNDLRRNHQKIKDFDYNKKIEWILSLMRFSFKYYSADNKHFPFANASLLGSTTEAIQKRFKYVGNNVAKFVINKFNPQNISASIDNYALEVLGNLEDDVFLDESQVILRMIFETIHQLPREKRGALLDFLPWGANSWYFLEFCSTFFRDSEEDSSVPFMYPVNHGESDASIMLYNEFQKSLMIDNCLVKVVIPDLLKEDLHRLYHFFTTVQANLIDPLNSIKPLEELPNLKPLLWYFKHTYQFARLTALLPAPMDQKTYVHHIDGAQPCEISPLVHLLLLTPTEDSLVGNLKSKLALIRRIQMVGEVFTRRGWGNQLDTIDYVDAELLNEIRNGLSHLEDLHSFAHIFELEHNNAQIIDLYKELNHLRDKIYQVIKNRQMQFNTLPDVTSPFKVWKGSMTTYWNRVKDYYKQPVPFNPQTFVPSVPLLENQTLTKFLDSINKNSQYYKKVCSMLRGEIPMEQLSFDETKDLSTPAVRQAIIKKTLKTASKKYTELKNNFIKQKSAERKAEEQALLNTKKTVMQNDYPHLRALGFTSYDQLHKPEKMSVRSLLHTLQSRFEFLRKILIDSGVNFDDTTSAEVVKSLITSDVEVLLSCSYLITQIVSIMNKLDGLEALEVIHPQLPVRLPCFIALRNALEHNDPVIDSKDNNFIQMQSNTNILMAQITHELIDQFFVATMKADPILMADNPDDFITEKETPRSKQAAAIDCTTLEYPDLPVRMIPVYGVGARDLFFNTVTFNSELHPAEVQESNTIKIGLD